MPEAKKQSSFFGKIPKTKLLTPGGMIATFLCLTIDLLDYLLDFIGILLWRGLHYEIINWPIKTFGDIFVAIFVPLLIGIPISSSLLPFLIEIIPVVGTLVPSWVINIIARIL
jgi:hypothetical protein